MSKKTKIISIVLASVFVLAGIATGCYFLFFKKKVYATMENTYAISPAKNKNGNYEMDSFRDEDDNYYYYIWYLGKINSVPLQETTSGNSFLYNGNDYTITMRTTVSTEESVSKTISNASSHCTSISQSVEWGFDAGLRVGRESSMFGGHFDLHQSTVDTNTNTTTDTVEQSITNVVNQTKEETSELTISFNSNYKKGSYRYVLFGNIEVYTVLVYNKTTDEYYCQNIEKVANIIGAGLEYSEDGSFEKDHYDKFDFEFPNLEELTKNPPTTQKNFNEELKDDFNNDIIEDGTESHPFIIKTPEDLINISNDMNAHYELANDINLINYSNWYPIGGYNKDSPAFTGVFDGKNYTIKNFNTDRTLSIKNYRGYFGLFGRVSGIIKNLKFSSVNISLKIDVQENDTRFFQGVVAGALVGGTIDNVTILSGSLKHSDDHRGEGQLGGIVGLARYSSISNCTNSMESIYSFRFTGVAGGIAGYAITTTFTNCVNNSKLTSRSDYGGWSVAGGIVGLSNGSYKNTYNNCYNYGQIDTQKQGWFDNTESGDITGRLGQQNLD